VNLHAQMVAAESLSGRRGVTVTGRRRIPWGGAASAQVHPFALRAEYVQQLHGPPPVAADRVGDAGVELGCLASGEREIGVAEHEAELPGDDVDPFVAFMDLLFGGGLAGAGSPG